jgi:hypothetical protein
MEDEMNKTLVKFESGHEDRFGPTIGPFSYVQIVYGTIHVGKDPYEPEKDIATYVDGWWIDEENGEKWSDVIIWGEP